MKKYIQLKEKHEKTNIINEETRMTTPINSEAKKIINGQTDKVGYTADIQW